MAFETNRPAWGGTATTVATIDAGLRAHMLRVYNYMASGLLLTGIVAYVTANTPSVFQAIFGTPLMWVVMLAPLGFVFFLQLRLDKIKASTAQALFWAFAAVFGLSLSTVFVAFTGASVARVFFITAGTFAAMSLYGYTTRKSLASWGSFLFMGLIGILIAGLVNMFIQSTQMQIIISVVGVLVFVGLTAYDTQRIKEEYSEHHDRETSGKLAIWGALRLYLDFINLFMMLMNLLGQRR